MKLVHNGAYSFVIGNGENSRRSKLTKFDLGKHLGKFKYS